MKKLLAVLLLLCLALPAALGEEAPSTDLTAIRINEFMASNSETLEDQNGETPDWIELYNTSDRPVNLQGLCLSDGKKTLDNGQIEVKTRKTGDVRMLPADDFIDGIRDVLEELKKSE